MTGYEYIRSMPDTEISKAFMVGILAAVNIRNSTVEELIHSEYICPHLLNGDYPCNCKEETYNCVKCRREFLNGQFKV